MFPSRPRSAFTSLLFLTPVICYQVPRGLFLAPRMSKSVSKIRWPSTSSVASVKASYDISIRSVRCSNEKERAGTPGDQWLESVNWPMPQNVDIMDLLAEDRDAISFKPRKSTICDMEDIASHFTREEASEDGASKRRSPCAECPRRRGGACTGLCRMLGKNEK
mmetsp:Transcript_14239/g.23894  ORF Transcript_14239/g.23894 Transcript_14239/m.23894 type:complete len:164 (-) Transcript_14239:147-638(-)